jgi:hypothetical protein
MMKSSIHRRLAVIGAMAGLSLALAVAQAQVQTIDPNSAIDGDLAAQPGTTPAAPAPVQPRRLHPAGEQAPYPGPALPVRLAPRLMSPLRSAVRRPRGGQSWHEDDLIGAAEGVFGKGAKGLAMMIRDILKKQGEPIGYITGREAGGAWWSACAMARARCTTKIEGDMPVYWTGPSIGFDAGANAGSTFVLVYNLYDTADLYHRFGAGEGRPISSAVSTSATCGAAMSC